MGQQAKVFPAPSRQAEFSPWIPQEKKGTSGPKLTFDLHVPTVANTYTHIHTHIS